MSGDDELHLHGTVTFDPPVALSGIETEYGRLLNSGLGMPTYAGDGTDPALTGFVFADATWVDAGIWFSVLGVVEDIARRCAPTMSATVSFDSDNRGRGRLLVDAGGHLHLCVEGEDASIHLDRACSHCLRIYRPHVGDTFQVAEVTESALVRVTELGTDPYVDFLVVCDEHGEVGCVATRQEAVFRREQHLITGHSPRPLPLGPVPAREILGEDVLRHIDLAARELRNARYYAGLAGQGGGAVGPRESARAHARQALAALGDGDPGQLAETLVHLLVEQRAGR
ncbi:MULTISPECIES: hypothetical protein [unclassified Streptomyces]|uniref:hypothetical protein n=1 Tax=unclassified Streptomyces TaxID=2593676 RepID=UPI00225BC1B0|nr:hypothetical protein [Streptomyces sp. NBC_01264]MCX4784121.1 hypothetical protein [Streptomyces sp. NBC_01264]